jgi:hypothetical protein
MIAPSCFCALATKTAAPLVEAVTGRRVLVAIAQLILAELAGGVVLGLEQRGGACRPVSGRSDPLQLLSHRRHRRLAIVPARIAGLRI